MKGEVFTRGGGAIVAWRSVRESSREEVMKHCLNTLLLVSLAGLIVPHAVAAYEPNVTTEAKSKAPSSPAQSACLQVPDTYRTVGPFTVQELEANSLREWDKKKEELEGSVPRVPFGKASAQWKEFLRQMRKADELFMYDEGCCSGIIIVRRGCIVDWFQISESQQ